MGMYYLERNNIKNVYLATKGCVARGGAWQWSALTTALSRYSEAESGTASQTGSRLAKKRRQFFCVLSLQCVM